MQVADVLSFNSLDSGQLAWFNKNTQSWVHIDSSRQSELEAKLTGFGVIRT